MADEYPGPEWFRARSFMLPRQISGGAWQAVTAQSDTTAIMVVDDGAAIGDWLYSESAEAVAIHSMWLWDGSDPPGKWIERRGFGLGNATNPRWLICGL